MEKRAEIGVFGGSGFYSMGKMLEEFKMETPYGSPSDYVALTEIGGRKVAFLARHGKDHRYPPHMIPFRANLWAMKKLGVDRIIAPCAAGSLDPVVKPGDFVLCDQFIDRTRGRKDTFYDGPITTHVSCAEPYCPELRKIAAEAGKKLGITVHEEGIMVIIQGPRFSTKAESRWFSRMGCQVINMTSYPEVVLARELEICYVNISLITDYDAGLEGNPEIVPVTTEEVLRVFKENNEKVKDLILEMISQMPRCRFCKCGESLKGARL